MNLERPWETYRAARADLMQRLETFERPPLTRYVGTIGDLSEVLTRSDLLFREAERCEALGVHPERARDARDAANRYNDIARSILAQEAPVAVRALREDLRILEMPDVTELFVVGERVIREDLAEWPFNVYEAREADQIIGKVFEQGRMGPDVLCDAATESLQKLDNLRARRNQHNDAGLAILGGLCLLGFVALMFYCAAPGGPTCTSATILVYGGLLLIAAGLLLYFGGLILAAAA